MTISKQLLANSIKKQFAFNYPETAPYSKENELAVITSKLDKSGRTNIILDSYNYDPDVVSSINWKCIKNTKSKTGNYKVEIIITDIQGRIPQSFPLTFSMGKSKSNGKLAPHKTMNLKKNTEYKSNRELCVSTTFRTHLETFCPTGNIQDTFGTRRVFNRHTSEYGDMKSEYDYCTTGAMFNDDDNSTWFCFVIGNHYHQMKICDAGLIEDEYSGSIFVNTANPLLKSEPVESKNSEIMAIMKKIEEMEAREKNQNDRIIKLEKEIMFFKNTRLDKAKKIIDPLISLLDEPLVEEIVEEEPLPVIEPSNKLQSIIENHHKKLAKNPKNEIFIAKIKDNKALVEEIIDEPVVVEPVEETIGIPEINRSPDISYHKRMMEKIMAGNGNNSNRNSNRMIEPVEPVSDGVADYNAGGIAEYNGYH